MSRCYCKSGLSFSSCCEPILKVESVAKTALGLMKSRYSAYCLGDVNYLKATTHNHTWSDEELKMIQDWADNSFWQHLEIVDYTEDSVEFKAYYLYDGKQHVHHEKSVFLKVNDMWKYIDGEILEDKVSFLRNEKCICGSGLKYKRCCFKKITDSTS
ncbi:MAG: YchJ family metal-binding protein [Campylobacterota bacterium]|nr:YchJ family metal-binding protein [Campylobacterota bacterium]